MIIKSICEKLRLFIFGSFIIPNSTSEQKKTAFNDFKLQIKSCARAEAALCLCNLMMISIEKLESQTH